MKLIFVYITIIFFTIGCNSKNSSKSTNDSESGIHEVIVQEVIQVPGYTYLRVKENNNEQWLAVTTMEAKAGETYYYSEGFQMIDFESKDLKRKFESITFLENLSTEPLTISNESQSVSPGSSKSTLNRLSINITPEDGSVTISELYEKKEAFSGKIISVRGQVTKFSPEIMGKNWIHLQDGTDFNGNFDLTITSGNIVSIGDTITLTGKIILNKDLGYGYFFDVLMEDAILK